jgi:hypothetical protein
MILNESIVKGAALEWFGELGCVLGHVPRSKLIEPSADWRLVV